MAKLTVDGREFEVPDGRNLLHACLSLGFDLPYFCWHPAMGSVGACRQCAVKNFKDEKDTRGRIVMACMTPAADGTRISIDDAEVRRFRKSIIEWLMLNHPHDCPVCDEGGECHLQDMTVMTGHDYRETRFPKRTYRNQDLGPFVTHEMNRCIACYRCVRFYRDYAGGRDLDVFGAHDHVYFGRQSDGVLESEFAGNLVEVCPTGVFTDKTLHAHYTRKWDLTTAPSVCVHCSVGCNTIPGARYGTVRRIRNRYHSEVNGYFLCDRGRYGYEFANGPQRLVVALAAGKPVAPAEAAERAAALLRESHGVVGIGSSRATLETLFALRELVGEASYSCGLPERDRAVAEAIAEALRGPAPTASLRDVRAADALLVLGEDPTETAPMVALAIRQSVRVKPRGHAEELRIPPWNDAAVRQVVQDATGPLFVAALAPTKLDAVATRTLAAAPADVARFGFAIAHELGAPVGGERLPGHEREAAREAARALREAERPVVVAGSGSGEPAVVRAAAAVAWRLRELGRDARLCLTPDACDGAGSALLGGGSLEGAAAALRDGRADTLVVAENDLHRAFGAQAADALLGSARAVIALDVLRTRTVERADVALPSASFAEGTGTLVNHEGRAQRSFRVIGRRGDVREGWRWLAEAAAAAGGGWAEALAGGRGRTLHWRTEDDVLAELAERVPELAAAAAAAPPATLRLVGRKVARQPHRYSGRTAIRAAERVREEPPPSDPDSPLAFSMEGSAERPPSALIPRYWAGGWDSVQALNKYQQEVDGPLKGGPPGVRLLEPPPDAARTAKPPYAADVPERFERRRGEWLLVPAHHVFGSEELSSLAPGVASLMPRPYVGLGPEDAAAMGAREGSPLRIVTPDAEVVLPLRLIAGLPAGVAALPAGLPGTPVLPAPGWATIAREREEAHR